MKKTERSKLGARLFKEWMRSDLDPGLRDTLEESEKQALDDWVAHLRELMFDDPITDPVEYMKEWKKRNPLEFWAEMEEEQGRLEDPETRDTEIDKLLNLILQNSKTVRKEQKRDKGRRRGDKHEERDVEMAEEFLSRWSGKLGKSKTALAEDIGGSRNANGQLKYVVSYVVEDAEGRAVKKTGPLGKRTAVDAVKKGLKSLKKLNPHSKDWSEL